VVGSWQGTHSIQLTEEHTLCSSLLYSGSTSGLCKLDHQLDSRRRPAVGVVHARRSIECAPLSGGGRRARLLTARRCLGTRSEAGGGRGGARGREARGRAYVVRGQLAGAVSRRRRCVAPPAAQRSLGARAQAGGGFGGPSAQL